MRASSPSLPSSPSSALDSVLNPTAIFDYTTYLRRLGRKLKERDVPRLNFSEVTIASDLSEFPHKIFITIETPQQLIDGYILVKFDRSYSRAGCDFEGTKPIAGARLTENHDLFMLLANQRGYAFEIGEHLFLPSKPIHVVAYGKEPLHVSRVMFLYE